MHLSSSGFNSERGAFCTDLNLNEFKQIGFIRLIRCLSLNVAAVCSLCDIVYNCSTVRHFDHVSLLGVVYV